MLPENEWQLVSDNADALNENRANPSSPAAESPRSSLTDDVMMQASLITFCAPDEAAAAPEAAHDLSPDDDAYATEAFTSTDGRFDESHTHIEAQESPQNSTRNAGSPNSSPRATFPGRNARARRSGNDVDLLSALIFCGCIFLLCGTLWAFVGNSRQPRHAVHDIVVTTSTSPPSIMQLTAGNALAAPAKDSSLQTAPVQGNTGDPAGGYDVELRLQRLELESIATAQRLSTMEARMVSLESRLEDIVAAMMGGANDRDESVKSLRDGFDSQVLALKARVQRIEDVAKLLSFVRHPPMPLPSQSGRSDQEELDRGVCTEDAATGIKRSMMVVEGSDGKRALLHLNCPFSDITAESRNNHGTGSEDAHAVSKSESDASSVSIDSAHEDEPNDDVAFVVLESRVETLETNLDAVDNRVSSLRDYFYDELAMVKEDVAWTKQWVGLDEEAQTASSATS